ncbi:MAG TPA: ABC transporter permease [Sporichthyaceae bacterium]|jgi:putative ABC transport system permease protein
MRAKESFRFAWRGIAANKMRSVLTMLGIIIGVASVITLVAVGTGSQAAVQASIDRLGSNTLTVIAMPTGGGGRGSAFRSRLRHALGLKNNTDNGTHTRASQISQADADALADPTRLPDVLSVAPIVAVRSVAATVGTSSHTVQSLTGSTANYLQVNNDVVSAGMPFTDQDVTLHHHLLLVGTSVAQDLTQGDVNDLVGQNVRLNGQQFTVSGILGSKGYSGQQDLDDRVIAPITAVQDTLYGYNPGTGELTGIAVLAATGRVQQAQREVQSMMDQLHHVSAANTDVIVFNSASVLDASSSSNHTLTILLAAVAGISLLVGGIGVMNIMLVSVTERTREIGIRKAIGADPRDIIGQFLGEAVILSLLGGMIGVGFGMIASRFEIAGVEPVIAPYSIYLSLGVSLLTGLFFGLYPASRAASLRPIEALRYE